MGGCCDGKFPYGKHACSYDREEPKWGQIIPLVMLAIPILGYLLSA